MPEDGVDRKARGLLYDTLGKLKPDELVDLIESLLSSAEIKDISRRILVAKLLKTGKTYAEVVDILGMSESTVNKIHFKTKGSPIINQLFKNRDSFLRETER